MVKPKAWQLRLEACRNGGGHTGWFPEAFLKLLIHMILNNLSMGILAVLSKGYTRRKNQNGKHMESYGHNGEF